MKLARPWSDQLPDQVFAGHSQEGDELADYMPKSQPALLTVTADGILRVWVEVTMESASGTNPLATEPSAALPGLPGGTHFCVTLVIQSPAGFWSNPLPPTLRATWCIPDGGVFALTGPQIRAAKVLWIVAIAKGPGQPLAKYASSNDSLNVTLNT